MKNKLGRPSKAEWIAAKEVEINLIGREMPTGDLVLEPGERVPSKQQIEAMLDEFERE